MTRRRKPLKLILYVRADGVRQHYHVASDDMAERDALLTPGELAGIAEIPRDHILRYRKPRSIVSAVMGELGRTDPLPRPAPPLYLPDEADVRRYAEKRGRTDEAALASLRGTRAGYDGKNIVILPQAYRGLAGGNMAVRATAVRTVAHEYWHALKGYMGGGYHPLEEGGADLFADRFMLRVLGADFTGQGSYPALREAVEALEGRLGKLWLKRSRKAKNQQSYLAAGLDQINVSPEVRAQVLGYTADIEQEQFLRAVLFMLEQERR